MLLISFNRRDRIFSPNFPNQRIEMKNLIIVIQTKFWYILGSPKTKQLGNQVKHLLIILSILLLSSPVIGDNHN